MKNKNMNRNRIVYFLLIIATILIGLASRHYSTVLPQWVYAYLGDGLWALMVFLMFGFIFRRKNSHWIAIMALAFSYGIELSQLYHAPWIDAMRANKLGGLILGFGFLWSDLICYTVGIGFGYIIETVFAKMKLNRLT
jgi:glycopeptide antibiotics resistance protein